MDNLTGLLTRNDLEDHKMRRKSILLVDIKHLMVINDKYGHNIGDLIIKEVSSILTSTIDNHESIYRYGGNLFLILSNDINNLQHSIEFAIEDFKFSKDIDLKVNFGRSNYNRFNSFENMFELADIDLYNNKSKFFN